MEPLVQIMSSVRQAERWLPKFLEQLDGLVYPEDRLRFSFVEGGSTDRSREILLDWLKTKKDVYYRQIDMPENWPPRRRMWFSGNHCRQLLKQDMQGVEPADYLLICDCDVVKLPENLIQELMEKDVDIVAPYVYVDPENDPRNPCRLSEFFFDTWAFRFLHGPQPGLTNNNAVPDFYKRNMEKNRSIKADLVKRLIPMQSVGACPVLIKADVVRKVDYWGDKAIIGFCEEAREKGFKVWSYPDMKCLHTWRREE